MKQSGKYCSKAECAVINFFARVRAFWPCSYFTSTTLSCSNYTFTSTFFSGYLLTYLLACLSPNSTWLVTSRHSTTRTTCRDERVEPCCSTSSTPPKCMGSTRRTCRVVPRRDVTRQVEFGLYLPACLLTYLLRRWKSLNGRLRLYVVVWL